MSLAPFQVQAPAPVRRGLEAQAAELGFLSANQWASVILKSFSELPAPQAMVALGRLRMLSRCRPPAIARRSPVSVSDI
jgi:hypothetical protein